MELWIRSQGKECLTKVNRLYIRKIYGALKEYDKFEINQEDGIGLAIYKSKKRSLEVLDEIQKIINGEITKQKEVESQIVGRAESYIDTVYEIPKE